MNARPSLQPKLTTVAVALLATALAAPAFGSSCWEKGNWRVSEGQATIWAELEDADSEWTVTNREFLVVGDSGGEKARTVDNDEIQLKKKPKQLWDGRLFPLAEKGHSFGIFFKMDFKSDGGIEDTCAAFESRTRKITGAIETEETRYLGLDCRNGAQNIISSCKREFTVGKRLHRLHLTLK
jgi:hypothetical protein